MSPSLELDYGGTEETITLKRKYLSPGRLYTMQVDRSLQSPQRIREKICSSLVLGSYRKKDKSFNRGQIPRKQEEC